MEGNLLLADDASADLFDPRVHLQRAKEIAGRKLVAHARGADRDDDLGVPGLGAPREGAAEERGVARHVHVVVMMSSSSGHVARHTRDAGVRARAMLGLRGLHEDADAWIREL